MSSLLHLNSNFFLKVSERFANLYWARISGAMAGLTNRGFAGNSNLKAETEKQRPLAMDVYAEAIAGRVYVMSLTGLGLEHQEIVTAFKEAGGKHNPYRVRSGGKKLAFLPDEAT